MNINSNDGLGVFIKGDKFVVQHYSITRNGTEIIWESRRYNTESAAALRAKKYREENE